MTMQTISFAIFSIIVMVLAFIVLWKIWTDEISLKGLLSESFAARHPAVRHQSEPVALPDAGLHLRDRRPVHDAVDGIPMASSTSRRTC